MEVVAALLLFALFLCGLLNSLFSPHPKLFPWLRSLLLAASSPPVNPLPKPTEIKEKRKEFNLETLFSTFDTDGDGFISKGELEKSLTRLGLAASGGEMRSVMERVDANGDGLIDLDEFRELCFSLGIASRVGAEGGEEEEEEEKKEWELRETFGIFDSNGDGLITMEELGMVLKSLGLKHGDTAEACSDMIKKVDLDGDGMVNFEEFKKMMVTNGGKVF